MPMPQPAIGLLKNNDDDHQLERILRRLGYRVFAYTRCHLMFSSLAGHGANLALIDRPLGEKEISLIKKYRSRETKNAATILCCGTGQSPRTPPGCSQLVDPLDIPALHRALQRHMTQYDRKKLRASIRLPALVCDRGEHLLGEVNVLGTGGAQLQSSTRPLRTGQNLEVVIPLLGQKKELEIPCRVVYAREPVAENNFHYQAGIQFLTHDDELVRDLEHYLSCHLLTAPDDNGYHYRPAAAPSHII